MLRDEFRYVFINPENVKLKSIKNEFGEVNQLLLCFSKDKAYELKLHPINSLIQRGSFIEWDELQSQLTVGRVNEIVATKSNLGGGHLWVEISQDGITTRIECENIDGLS